MDLQTQLDKAEADTVTRHAVGASDAGAQALAGLLAGFGVTVAAGAVTNLMLLVGVLALEIGSALAVVLCRAMAPPATIVTPSDGVAKLRYSKPEDLTAEIVTETKRKGRPPIFGTAMTGAERMKRHRERSVAISSKLN